MFQCVLSSLYTVRHQTIMVKPGTPPVVMGLSEVIMPMGSGPSVLTQFIREQWDVHPSRIVIHGPAPDGIEGMHGFLMSLLWPSNGPDHWGVITIDGLPVARWERTLDGTTKRRLFVLWISEGDIQTLLQNWEEENDWLKLDFNVSNKTSLALTMMGMIREDVSPHDVTRVAMVKLGI